MNLQWNMPSIWRKDAITAILEHSSEGVLSLHGGCKGSSGEHQPSVEAAKWELFKRPRSMTGVRTMFIIQACSQCQMMNSKGSAL